MNFLISNFDRFSTKLTHVLRKLCMAAFFSSGELTYLNTNSVVYLGCPLPVCAIMKKRTCWGNYTPRFPGRLLSRQLESRMEICHGNCADQPPFHTNQDGGRLCSTHCRGRSVNHFPNDFWLQLRMHWLKRHLYILLYTAKSSLQILNHILRIIKVMLTRRWNQWWQLSSKPASNTKLEELPSGQSNYVVTSA